MSDRTDQVLYVCGTLVMLVLILAIAIGASLSGQRGCAAACGPSRMLRFQAQIGVSPEQCQCVGEVR